MAKLTMPFQADDPPPDPEPNTFAQAIAAAQADLALAGESGPMRRDPYRITLAAQSIMLGTFLEANNRWEQATDAVIAARNPLPPEHMEALKYELVTSTQNGASIAYRAEAKRYLRTIDRKLAMQIGSIVGAAFVAGGIVVAALGWSLSAGPFTADKAWQDIIAINPDPRPALAGAATQLDRNSGRRYYSGVSLWLDPSHGAPK